MPYIHIWLVAHLIFYLVMNGFIKINVLQPECSIKSVSAMAIRQPEAHLGMPLLSGI